MSTAPKLDDDNEPILAGLSEPPIEKQPTPLPYVPSSDWRGKLSRRLINTLQRGPAGTIELVLSAAERSEVLEIVRVRTTGQVVGVTTLFCAEFGAIISAFDQVRERSRERHASKPLHPKAFRREETKHQPGVPRGTTSPK